MILNADSSRLTADEQNAIHILHQSVSESVFGDPVNENTFLVVSAQAVVGSVRLFRWPMLIALSSSSIARR